MVRYTQGLRKKPQVAMVRFCLEPPETLESTDRVLSDAQCNRGTIIAVSVALIVEDERKTCLMHPSNAPTAVAEHRAQRYAALVDWSRRLHREKHFFGKWFDRVGARRVLDVACGTGHHATLFHSWGMTVEGADIDPAMIEYCRREHPSSDTLVWRTRSFTEPCARPQSCDVVLCIGNSLALAVDLRSAEEAFVRMFEALRAGGCAIIQVLNLQRIQEGRMQWTKCRRVRIGDRDVILLKGIHRIGDLARLEIVELAPSGELMDSRTSNLLSIGAATLTEWARNHRVAEMHVFGDYTETAFNVDSSTDVILVVRK
jgi:SAM-dependent methyltransferase